MLLGNRSSDISAGEALCFNRGIVAQASLSPDFGVRDGRGFLVIGTLVDGDDRGTTEPKILLKSITSLLVLNESVVGPSSKMPNELGALS